MTITATIREEMANKGSLVRTFVYLYGDGNH